MEETPAGYTFGVEKPKDREGAREVSMVWKSHQRNPDAQPGPNYIAMNKTATQSGVIRSDELLAFRKQKHIPLKGGLGSDGTEAPKPLPSEVETNYVYGRASNNRPIEEIRMSGPAPSMSNLVQGTFVYEWVDKNQARKEALNAHHKKIVPLGTKATQGHAAGGAKSKQAGEVGGKTWKMKKFQDVKPRIAI